MLPDATGEELLIVLPNIVLEWTPWYRWDDILLDSTKGGAAVPNVSGVYEVRRTSEEQRLTIGKAANLRMCIKQGLVRGKTRHSTSRKIRAQEKTGALIIRWAETDRPAAVEEELHRQHQQRFGQLPSYTQHT